MKDKIIAAVLACALIGGLALAGSENNFMPWLNFAGLFLIGGVGIVANKLSEKW
jgi:hypothetical protein